MLRVLFATILLAFTAATAAWAEPVTIPRSDVFSLRSAEGREYRISVAWPAGEPPAEGWRVIYMADADLMFASAVEAVRAFERRPDGRGNPRTAVVVGVGYPPGADIIASRTLDLTPPGAENVPDPRGRPPTANGGAGAFLTFVETVLKPEVQRRWRINRARQTAMGHSYGGLFVLHALFSRPDAFQTYVALSPSIWFGDRIVLREATAYETRRDRPAARVLLTAAEYEQAVGGPTLLNPNAAETGRRLQGMRQIDNGRELQARLAALTGVTARFHLFAGEDHGSGIPAAIGRGVLFALYPDLDAVAP